jgi:hypothetical protein
MVGKMQISVAVICLCLALAMGQGHLKAKGTYTTEFDADLTFMCIIKTESFDGWGELAGEFIIGGTSQADKAED